MIWDRIVSVTVLHDDGGSTGALYVVPDEWTPPDDWEHVGSQHNPPGTDVEHVLEQAGSLVEWEGGLL